jgi:hypothetical protein
MSAAAASSAPIRLALASDLTRAHCDAIRLHLAALDDLDAAIDAIADPDRAASSTAVARRMAVALLYAIESDASVTRELGDAVIAKLEARALGDREWLLATAGLDLARAIAAAPSAVNLRELEPAHGAWIHSDIVMRALAARVSGLLEQLPEFVPIGDPMRYAFTPHPGAPDITLVHWSNVPCARCAGRMQHTADVSAHDAPPCCAVALRIHTGAVLPLCERCAVLDEGRLLPLPSSDVCLGCSAILRDEHARTVARWHTAAASPLGRVDFHLCRHCAEHAAIAQQSWLIEREPVPLEQPPCVLALSSSNTTPASLLAATATPAPIQAPPSTPMPPPCTPMPSQEQREQQAPQPPVDVHHGLPAAAPADDNSDDSKQHYCQKKPCVIKPDNAASDSGSDDDGGSDSDSDNKPYWLPPSAATAIRGGSGGWTNAAGERSHTPQLSPVPSCAPESPPQPVSPYGQPYDPLVLLACDDAVVPRYRRRRVDAAACDDAVPSEAERGNIARQAAALDELTQLPSPPDDALRYLDFALGLAEFHGPVARDAARHVNTLKRRVDDMVGAINTLRDECDALWARLAAERCVVRNMRRTARLRRYRASWDDAPVKSAPASPARDDEVPARR